MNNLLRTTVYSLLMLLVAGQAMAQELSIYPAKDQSAEQMDKDKYECYNWAKKDSGFDPMAAPKATTPAPKAEKKKGGAVKGAAAGAVAGKVLGNSSKTTKRSAAAGGLALANCYSSRFGKLIEAAAVSLPTEFVQLDWQFGNDASYFSRRITAE